jgi:transcriptional regulator with XRE-family HTH domain
VSTVAGRNGGTRTELAAFLRSRRARITPSDVGLPPGLRRRTPGLRREEVAQLAGVGVTWYTWLEQGRPINASPQILDAVARTLRLDSAERAHLYRLSGVSPEAPVAAAEERVEPSVRAVLAGLATMPAAILNSRYDLLAHNAAYAAMWPNVTGVAPGERNLMWSSCVTPGCCSSFVNRDTELPQMVATFRAAFARHVGEPEWTGLIRRLSAASPEFARRWGAHDVAHPATRTKVFRHAAVGEVSFAVTNFEVVSTPEARMAVYTPVDGPSRERMDWLIAHPDAAPVDHTHGSVSPTAGR